MQLLMWITVITVAIALLGAGLYFQLRRQALQSDPVLIRSCYLGGGALLLCRGGRGGRVLLRGGDHLLQRRLRRRSLVLRLQGREGREGERPAVHCLAIPSQRAEGQSSAQAKQNRFEGRRA